MCINLTSYILWVAACWFIFIFDSSNVLYYFETYYVCLRNREEIFPLSWCSHYGQICLCLFLVGDFFLYVLLILLAFPEDCSFHFKSLWVSLIISLYVCGKSMQLIILFLSFITTLTQPNCLTDCMMQNTHVSQVFHHLDQFEPSMLLLVCELHICTEEDCHSPVLSHRQAYFPCFPLHFW